MGRIIGTGMAVSELIVPNKTISNNPEWIEETLGIKERRISSGDYSGLQLAVDAGINAIKSADLLPKDIDLIIVATATPAMIAPSTASLVATNLGINCCAFDINAVCSGFIYALVIGDRMNTGNALIIGMDTFSKITDWGHRDCIFFGDGAGAVVLSKGDNLLSSVITGHSDNNGFTCEQWGFFDMNGKKVYENALKLVPNAIKDALKRANLNIDDIDYMVPHQPSKRILLDIADKIGLPIEKVLMNMDKYANTSAGTIPILLHESWSKFKKGDKLLFAAIGSGWTYGAAIYEV